MDKAERESERSRQPSSDGRSTAPRPPRGGWIAWMQLVRLPNVFTVLADVGAAFLLAAGTAQPVARFAVILAAGVALYWAGMILNDVFDVEKDRAERSQRPLASGAISLAHASIAGWVLLVAGVVLAFVCGFLPGPRETTTFLPGLVALGLAALIIAYDGPLKATPLAPAAMGGCRLLSFLLGASPVLPELEGGPLVPRAILGVAFGFGVYIMGVTTMARDEASGGHRINLRTGLVAMLLGAVLLAFAPGLASPQMMAVWTMRPGGQFALLVGLIVLPAVVRALRAQFDPQPAVIGNAIRAGILTIIPLAACFAFLGAGQLWGLLVFALLLPSMLLSFRLRVT